MSRGHYTAVLLSASERELLSATAHAWGVSMGSVLRAGLFAVADEQRAPVAAKGLIRGRRPGVVEEDK